jgi:signal transduction histidine kinase
VRAVRDGTTSARTAAISFRVLPPVWRQWWAISTATLLLLVLIYLVHRYRLAHVVHMERVRMRIAMDLHDDLGSTLSNMSILSELARQQIGTLSGSQSLSRLAEMARELVASMGDIVWAVNPQRDRGADLIQRMRRFGQDLLTAQDVSFRCNAADSVLNVGIPADVRRDVYLIFKESVNNISRHAKCRHAVAEVTSAPGELRMEVRDDGVGFDPDGNGSVERHGLISMQRRAEQLGASLSVHSGDNCGTRIVLCVPLRRHLFRW